MRFLLDENAPHRVAFTGRRLGMMRYTADAR
jgi:hypothetical protein